MKFILLYCSVFLLALASIFPAKLIAGDREMDNKPFRYSTEEMTLPLFADSIPVRRMGEKKDQEKPEERRVPDFRGENLRERPKTGIKQVPRSIPKLKPKAVIDRIPIRRPPMKIPKKGLGGIHF